MVERRPPERVMRLSRLGSMHQCRLSFMRQLTRRLAGENWQFVRQKFEVNSDGVGHAVYSAIGPNNSYSLIAFAHDLPAEQRSDRVIATAWDATFTLFDGIPDQTDIDRLAQNIPLQEAGRVKITEISVSRANRSVRLWDHFVDSLSQGQQPDLARIKDVGYLMRTTAVYGSGKLGAADRETIAKRPELQAPFQAEMLSVYLTRWFVLDLVNHMARVAGGADAVPLDADLARHLGIGNSTGLGMAPFLINHPVLFNNWIIAREEAIARIRGIEKPSAAQITLFQNLFQRVLVMVADWRSSHQVQIQKLGDLTHDLALIQDYLLRTNLDGPSPWDAMMVWADNSLSVEGQECLASLILEPYGDVVDGLGTCMADTSSETFVIDGTMSIAQTMALIQQSHGWAIDLDWSKPENCARAWYVSQEKLEPRLGERFDEPIGAYEQPLAPARDAALAHRELAGWDSAAPIADFLAQHPEHRHSIRRAQVTPFAPYSEIRDNTISAAVMPIDMLRAKLAFFGATHFDPRSDRWVRICMYSGAPYPTGLTPENADFWVYPEVAQ